MAKARPTSTEGATCEVSPGFDPGGASLAKTAKQEDPLQLPDPWAPRRSKVSSEWQTVPPSRRTRPLQLRMREARRPAREAFDIRRRSICGFELLASDDVQDQPKYNGNPLIIEPNRFSGSKLGSTNPAPGRSRIHTLEEFLEEEPGAVDTLVSEEELCAILTAWNLQTD